MFASFQFELEAFDKAAYFTVFEELDKLGFCESVVAFFIKQLEKSSQIIRLFNLKFRRNMLVLSISVMNVSHVNLLEFLESDLARESFTVVVDVLAIVRLLSFT